MTFHSAAAATIHRWTEAEDATLARLYTAGQPVPDIADALPGRSLCAVRTRTDALNLTRNPITHWTDDEDTTLKHLFAETDTPLDQIADTLPGRSPEAIRTRARTLHLNRPTRHTPWTDPEDTTLKHLYADGATHAAIADALPERTLDAVHDRIKALNLPPRHRRWTPTEDRTLIRLRKRGFTLAHIATQIPGRDTASVKGRNRVLVNRGLLPRHPEPAPDLPTHWPQP